MKDAKEIWYGLITIDDPGELQNTPGYRGCQGIIKDNGFMLFSNVKVYNPKLALIFYSESLPVENLDTGEQITVLTDPYLKTYIKAYQEGREYFDRKYGVKPDTLYGANSKTYVDEICENYLRKPHHKSGLTLRGWGQIRQWFPIILSHKNINGFGYFSGIVSMVEELISEHPVMFKDWEKCKQTAAPQQPVQPKPDYNKELTELKNMENQFWKGLPMEAVIKHFEVMTTKKNRYGKVFLTTEQLVSFLKRGFLNDTTQPKQKINCSTSEKGFVILRFYELYNLAASQYGHPNKKTKFIKLFIDCFDNWKAETIEPFFKPGKAKETW